MRACLGLLIAWVLGGPAAAFADPAYLPPFLDRVPAVGDRWVYGREGSAGTSMIVEVVEAAEATDGWRTLVEHRVELPLDIQLPVIRTEWFLRVDGSLRRGDGWVDGELSIDLGKPLAVLRRPPPSPLEKRARFGYLGLPAVLTGPVGTPREPVKRVKRRGWVHGVVTGRFDPWLGLPERGIYLVRLAPESGSVRGGKRPPSTMTVRYDEWLGRIGWSWDEPAAEWGLVAAEIGGETYEP